MREWTEGDLDALRMLAQVFANVLQRRRIELAVRQHEQELQTLIDNSPDIICRFNGEMRCLYFSAPEQGYIKAVAADVVGKSLFEMNLPDNEKALFEEAIRRVFLTGRPVTVVAAISIPQEQQPRYYQVRIAPMLDIKGNLESVMCVARDVTELERAKHEIEALNRSLELRVIERTQQLEEANRHLELEIEQHQRHKVELIASRVHIRDIAQRVVTAQEGERQRISRVLHDEVTQDLMALTMTLAWLQKKLPHDSTEQMHRLDACMLSIEMTTEQIRQLAHDLRPPSLDALGLDRALESYCKVLAERMSMYITYDGIVLPELPDRVSICLYRAAQEGLTNVVKHAQAKHIWVSLLYGSRGIMLTIRDDGQGFDVGAMRQRMATQAIPWGVGLRGMRERFELLGGRFSIHSSLHAGTRLTGFIPMHMIKEQTE
jgi:PAS domain S-box-containing protein